MISLRNVAVVIGIGIAFCASTFGASASEVPAWLQAVRARPWLPAVAMPVQFSITQAYIPTTNYYVSTAGSDSNDGLSPATPWQTIGKVNGFTFPATVTNVINFHGTQTFSGCLSLVGNSNFIGPGRVTSYGGGTATIQATSACDGSYNTEHAAVNLNGLSGFVWDGVNVLGDGFGTPFGIIVQNGLGDLISAHDVTIQNSFISGFSGEIQFVGLAYDGSCQYVAYNHVQFLNNVLFGASVTDADRTGIYGFGCGKNLYNVTYSGNTIYNIGGVASNSISGFGIDVDGVTNAVVSHNLVHDIGGNSTSCGGPSGLQAFTSDNVVFRYNEVYNVQPSPGYTTGCDFVGIDCDGGTTGCIIEYNYTHHNLSNGILLFVSAESCFGQPMAPPYSCAQWGPNIVRYNVSENDAWAIGRAGIIWFNSDGSTASVDVYNNSVWTNGTPGNPNIINALRFENLVPQSGVIANNVFGVVTGNDGFNTFVGTNGGSLGSTTLAFRNNDYFVTDSGTFPRWQWGSNSYTTLSTWNTGSGETGSLNISPGFPSAGSGGTCTWTPPNGPQPCPSAYNNVASGLKGTGVDLTASPFFRSIGTQDYYNNSITSTNIGAYGGM